MSVLVVEKLDTELIQEITYTLSERVHIAALIPYLLIYNNPSGTFSFEVLSSSDELLFQKSFLSSDVSSAQYAHVYYPIIPDEELKLKKGTYKIKISALGYIPSDSSYLAWIRQHEDVQAILDSEPENDTQNPLTIRIKTYKRVS